MRALRAAPAMALLALTACSTTATPTAAHPRPSAAATPTPRATVTVTPGSPDDPAPAAREAANPDPNFDYGYVVQITPTGFHPQWLVSGCCKPVTWRNLTGSSVSVLFDHQLVDSGPIPPGGTFVFTPHNVQSIAYHSGTSPSTIGVLQVNQTFES